MKKRTKGLVIAAVAATSALLATQARAGVVAYSGDTFTVSSDTASAFYTPVINDTGLIAFGGLSTSGTNTLYGPAGLSPSDGLQVLASEDGVQFQTLNINLPNIDTTGAVAFTGNLGDTTPGVFRIPAGGGTVVTVSVGTSVDYGSPAVNGGQTAFSATSASINSYYRADASNNLSTIASNTVNAAQPVINSSGRVVYVDGTTLYSAPPTSVATQTLSTGATITVGAGNRVVSSFDSSPDINSSGTTAVLIATTPTGDGGATDGLYTIPSTGGNPTAVVQVGDALPLGNSTGTLASFVAGAPSDPRINNAGQVAFVGALTVGGSVTADNKDGLWIGSNLANLQLVAREGSAAPGPQSGVVFEGISDYGFSINALGDVVFASSVTSTLGGSEEGLFAWTPGGGLQDLATAGDTLTIDNEPEIVASVSFAAGSGGGDGLPTGLNNSGEVVYNVNFTDGSSAILDEQLPTAIPEPAALSLIGVAGALLIRRRSHTMT